MQAIDVSCGKKHTMVIAKKGELDYGEIYAFGNQRATPIRIREIDCGSHTGGISSNGKLYMWKKDEPEGFKVPIQISDGFIRQVSCKYSGVAFICKDKS